MGKPNFEQLYKCYKHLMENASSVSTTLGRGNHGHLALIILLIAYQTMEGVPFPAPANPSPSPVQPHQFMTNAEINL
eukprot:4034439-Ditylum_brightwellii.AAC.1